MWRHFQSRFCNKKLHPKEKQTVTIAEDVLLEFSQWHFGCTNEPQSYFHSVVSFLALYSHIDRNKRLLQHISTDGKGATSSKTLIWHRLRECAARLAWARHPIDGPSAVLVLWPKASKSKSSMSNMMPRATAFKILHRCRRCWGVVRASHIQNTRTEGL